MPSLLYLSGNGTTAGVSTSGAVNATQAGTERFGDGFTAGTEAFLIEEATTNYAVNPIVAVDLAGIAPNSTSTFERVALAHPFGSHAAHAVFDGVGAYPSLAIGTTTGFNTAAVPQTATVTAWLRGAGTTNLISRWLEDGYTVATDAVVPVTLTDEWTEYTATSTSAPASSNDQIQLVIGDLTGAASSAEVYVTAMQIEFKDHATSHANGSMGTGYAWTGTTHASTSTRVASTLTIPLSGAWGSVAFRYKEAGAWQEGYLTAAGAIGTYGTLAHDGSEFTISTTRQLTIGPFMVFDRALTGTERDQLFGRNNWSLDVFSRITPNGLLLPL